MRKAVAWTAVAKYTTAALQLVFAAILSRILTPEQYGTVAVITIIVVFFQLFSDMGFGTAVIQDKELTEKQTNDIFSWTLYLGLILQMLFIGVSFPVSHFYEDVIYIPLGIILSVSLLFNSLNMIPNAIMLKQKRFKAITVRTVCSHVITSLIAIFLAYKNLGVYALVLQMLFSSIIIFVWNEATVALKFNIKPDFAVIKRIWGYSVYQLLAQILNFFSRNLDQLLIGKFFSKPDLGQYNKSYHLMQMPISYIPGVVGPALHPILSEHQDNPQYIYNSYLKLLKILSLLGCFMSAYLFYTADELIVILFGEQWYEAILPFRILALSVWFQLATNTFGPIYLSIGKTKLMFWSVAASCGLIVTSIIIGCLMGSIVDVATCVSVAYIINYFLSYWIMIRFGFSESFVKFLSAFWHEVVIFAILMAITLIPLNIENIVGMFVVKTLLIGLSYIGLLILTKQYKSLLSLVPSRFKYL